MKEYLSIMIIIGLFILIIITALIKMKYRNKIIMTLSVVTFLIPILGVPIVS